MSSRTARRRKKRLKIGASAFIWKERHRKRGGWPPKRTGQAHPSQLFSHEEVPTLQIHGRVNFFRQLLRALFD